VTAPSLAQSGAHDESKARKELRQAEERYRNELMDEEERLLLGDRIRSLRQCYEERPCGECSVGGTIAWGNLQSC
jgi:hypothetical protein